MSNSKITIEINRNYARSALETLTQYKLLLSLRLKLREAIDAPAESEKQDDEANTLNDVTTVPVELNLSEIEHLLKGYPASMPYFLWDKLEGAKNRAKLRRDGYMLSGAETSIVINEEDETAKEKQCHAVTLILNKQTVYLNHVTAYEYKDGDHIFRKRGTDIPSVFRVESVSGYTFEAMNCTHKDEH